MHRTGHESSVARQSGLSLIELMISITIGLVILAAVAAIFASSSRSRQETERSSRQIENGRYAMQLLSDDLKVAGFLGEFDPSVLSIGGMALPDPCATDLAALRDALPLHVQGVDNGGAIPSCLSDVKDGSDILVVRRASTCVAGATDCDPFADGTPHFQASLCTPATGGTELAFSASTNAEYAANWYALDTSAGNLTRQRTNCTTVADMRRYRTHIYFVANNSTSGDGIPTLKRAELGGGAFSIVPLVEGIESLHFEYGLDTNCNGTPDVYSTDPTAYTPMTAHCAPFAALAASAAGNWRNVVSAKIHLLARNTEASQGHADTKTYVLGVTADGADNTLGPYNDAYKRHAYTSAVRLANPAGKRE